MATTTPPDVAIHHLGLRDYADTWRRMQTFTRARGDGDGDQIWLLQHPPVFTRGTRRAAPPRAAHDDDAIPLIDTDRGGEITYHAPGQLIVYLLLDLKRRRLGPKALVRQVEQTVIDLLADHNIAAARRRGAPGVYVRDAKIAALGLRITRGCCFHGLSLNVAMNLAPYRRIDPCGYPGLAVTQMREHLDAVDLAAVEDDLARRLLGGFG
ncbi:MAG: lipoyl(octanoyl) transferase LipB [bacterium]